MAQVIDFDWDQRVMRRDGGYPWIEWFNGDTWSLKKGEDFEGDFASFRRLAYSQAKYHGYKIRTRVTKKDEEILIQKIEGPIEMEGQQALF